MITYECLIRKVVNDNEIMYQADGKDYIAIRRCRDERYPKEWDDVCIEYIGETHIALMGGGLMFLLFQDFLSNNEKAKNFLKRDVERHEKRKQYYLSHIASKDIILV